MLPSRNERFLVKTVDDLFKKAAGDIEVIAIIDGNSEYPVPETREGLIVYRHPQAKGMRQCINQAASIAQGEFLLKLDAHCMFAEGFDEILKADCDYDWLVIPRRVSLDAENWTIDKKGHAFDGRKAPVDYHYLSFPKYKGHGIHGTVWNERRRERFGKPEYDIDDEMSFQGSCWFMRRRYFWEHIGGLREEGYGPFQQEPQELGNKVWLGGGRVVVNKKTYYAHLHKGRRYGRGYFLSKRVCKAGNDYSVDFWMNDKWPDRVRDFSWLVEKFWPIPGWDENWQERWKEINV